MTPHRKIWAATLAAGAAATLPAAAPADHGRAGSSAQVVRVAAARNPTQFGELRFVQRRLHARRGRITFIFKNPAKLGHNFAVRRGKHRLGRTATISRGATRRLTLRLAAGRYTFYCAVPGHEASGMKGPLTVAR